MPSLVVDSDDEEAAEAVVGVEQWAELRREHFVAGKSIKELARSTGLSRNTIRRPLRSDRPPSYRRPARASVIEPFKDEIHRLLRADPKSRSCSCGWAPTPARVIRNRDLMLIYLAGIAILWNRWFFSFWSVSIVADATRGGFSQSALTATFFGVAGIIGFPLGGWLGDGRSAPAAAARACS